MSEIQNLPTFDRRHDLDALRAIAMLLGIVLHAALSFAPIPWTVQDSQQSDVYYVLFALIHGFRMPLFFMLSGFFTAMLWRKRGLGKLVQHRLKRILLPLVLGCFTIIPAMWAVSYFVNRAPATESETAVVWNAVVAGETERVQAAVESSEIAIDTINSDGVSMLTVAVFLGHTDTVEMLLNAGADPNQRNRDQGTALHSAAFVGRAKEASLLIRAGADPDIADQNGQTAKQLLNTDFATTNFIAASFGLTLDEAQLKSDRADIANQLGVKEYLGSGSDDAANARQQQLNLLYGLFFQLPVFMHLWFLWFLCWLVAAFLIYAPIAAKLKIKNIPSWLVCSPLSLLWLVPLTMLPQALMTAGSFGPDSSIGLLPMPSVLLYYAIFFFFGALYWDMDDAGGKLGHWWYISLPVALLIVFPVALDMASGTFGGIFKLSDSPAHWIVSSMLQAIFAWLMVFGCIGLFRWLLSGESKTMRYISDSSYWLYLVHLPIVIWAQWLVRDLEIPASLKLVTITIAVSAFLLLTYQYAVRYTVIGTVLNGKRTRPLKI